MRVQEPICIDLDLPSQRGFRQFISAWLYRDNGLTFVVDPGPLATIPHLLAELRKNGVKDLDYILLTHIHIDHAGGTGALLAAFPKAQVICHPEGIRHLIAPEKLWQGTLKVLGSLAEAYGEIVAVPAERISFRKEVGPCRVWITPGHAPHHLSFQVGDLLFAGEVAGVHYPLESGIFMRPATPPRFIPVVAQKSLAKMIALEPQRLVFAHYGLVNEAGKYLRIASAQLNLWVRGVAATATAVPEDREEMIIAWLRTHDDYYRNVDQLPEDILVRERYFLGNSLRGMIEYVDGLTETERKNLAAS
ncbi:MAG: MBL fold metallo-hydrolase [Deltaproteobacteria bacterium HGW-Deltaproteobacteria-4]|nr:MAG: MBL fold metallo-hydrolase [Deltaproteobacteria bacterium HGW-Deltaproteobacteria-4]